MALYESSNLSGYSLINEILSVIKLNFQYNVLINLKNLNLNEKINEILDIYDKKGENIKLSTRAKASSFNDKIDYIIEDERREKGYQNFKIFSKLYLKKEKKYDMIKRELEREMDIYLVNDVLKLASEKKIEEFSISNVREKMN